MCVLLRRNFNSAWKHEQLGNSKIESRRKPIIEAVFHAYTEGRTPLLYYLFKYISKMSRGRSTDSHVVQEALHRTQKDGTLPKRFNPHNGKWETANNGDRQNLAFDANTGRLLLLQNNDNPDSVIAITMAAAGFFVVPSAMTSERIKFMDNFKTVAIMVRKIWWTKIAAPTETVTK